MSLREVDIAIGPRYISQELGIMDDGFNSLEHPASEDSALLIQIQDREVSGSPGKREKRTIPDGVRNISP